MEFVDTNTTLRNVAQKIRGAPMVTLRRAMIQACREFCAQSHWLKDDVTMSTSSATSGLEGVFEIQLADADLLQAIAIRFRMVGHDPTGQPFKVWPDAAPQERIPDATPSTPRFYDYVPEGMFNLYPTPDVDYTLQFKAVVQPKDDVLRLPRDLFVKHQRVLDAGALSYLYTIDKQAFTNPAEGLRQQAIFQAGINNAKADAQRGYATGSVRSKPRRFTRY